MGPCCVEGCQVTSEETFYFEFPTSRILRRKWLEVIPIPGKLPLGTVVCSHHFSASDYENIRGKVRLKSKVVPSLLLHENPTPQNNTSPKEPSLPKSPSTLKSTPPPKSPSLPKSPKPPSPPNSPKSPKSRESPPKSPKSRESPPNSPKSRESPPKSPKSRESPPKSPNSRESPPKLQDNCDSTTVSVPSPVDAEKMIDDIQNEKRLAENGDVQKKSTEKDINEVAHKENGRSSDSDHIVVKSPHPNLPDPKVDIEDMITNYHIKNKVPNPALLADLMSESADLVPTQNDTETIEIEDVKEAEPVFIEISVDKNTPSTGNEDCLMLVESVQVDLDPSALMLEERDEDDIDIEDIDLTTEKDTEKKNDSISLLTSSDEDEVIIQEPHIDTVEVSDDTDEDDMPLVKLVKKPPLKKKLLKKKTKRPKEPTLDKIMWGMYDFYCMQCNFATKNCADYNKHVSEHSKVLHVCPICGYTSASKTMFSRHTRIHKVEKKFKCHLCDYRARHKMSLIYHLQNHDSESLNSAKCKKDFKCIRCNFRSVFKVAVLDHLKKCKPGAKKHCCDKCDYATKKKCDLKRHKARRHQDDDDINDIDYIPEA